MSVRADLNASNRNNFFELFGFDFLVDEDWRTWLLECNTNPYLGIPNDFIRKLLPNMVDDMLGIVLKNKFPAEKVEKVEKVEEVEKVEKAEKTEKAKKTEKTEKIKKTDKT